MTPEIHTIFSSDFYKLCDFRCQCDECGKSKREFNENFSICFIRTGNFYYHTYKQQLDAFTGSVLVSKPGYEYNVSHPTNMPDECSIFIFTTAFYEELKDQLKTASWFFKNKDAQSLLLKISPEIEHLHNLCLEMITNKNCSKLEVDSLVMEWLQQVLASFSAYEAEKKIPDKFKKNYLPIIEKAKQYIREHFTKDISLIELASYCHTSPFHFSRIFKSFTRYSPYQYLQLTRLKQAELLLKTKLPVADVAFSSGFNSIDYFSAAFKKKYKMSPSAYRNQLKIQQDF